MPQHFGTFYVIRYIRQTIVIYAVGPAYGFVVNTAYSLRNIHKFPKYVKAIPRGVQQVKLITMSEDGRRSIYEAVNPFKKEFYSRQLKALRNDVDKEFIGKFKNLWKRVANRTDIAEQFRNAAREGLDSMIAPASNEVRDLTLFIDEKVRLYALRQLGYPLEEAAIMAVRDTEKANLKNAMENMNAINIRIQALIESVRHEDTMASLSIPHDIPKDTLVLRIEDVNSGTVNVSDYTEFQNMIDNALESGVRLEVCPGMLNKFVQEEKIRTAKDVVVGVQSGCRNELDEVLENALSGPVKEPNKFDNPSFIRTNLLTKNVSDNTQLSSSIQSIISEGTDLDEVSGVANIGSEVFETGSEISEAGSEIADKAAVIFDKASKVIDTAGELVETSSELVQTSSDSAELVLRADELFEAIHGLPFLGD